MQHNYVSRIVCRAEVTAVERKCYFSTLDDRRENHLEKDLFKNVTRADKTENSN